MGNYATAWIDSWRVTQQILNDFRKRFLKFSPCNSIIACFVTSRSLYICNYNVLYTLVRWYLTESDHKCSRMCLWRDVDMQRIIDEPEQIIYDGVTDYWQMGSSFTTAVPFAIWLAFDLTYHCCCTASVSFVADTFYSTLNSCGEFLASYHVPHGIRKGAVELQNIPVQQQCFEWRRICEILM